MTEPLYQAVADLYRRRIEVGELAAGDILPSERVISAETGHARGTVRAGMQQLISEGLIISRPGIGYVVRGTQRLRWVATDPERNSDTETSPSDTWSRSIRAQGRKPSELIKVEIVKADPHIAGQLRIAEGDLVVVRRRLRSVDDEPYMIADSYYEEAVVRGTPIASPGDVLPGVYAIFEGLGRPWSSRKTDYVTSGPPRPDETARLDIPPGTSVLRVGRVSTDTGGVPVRYSVFVVPGDRGEIQYGFEEG